ncbi:MAG: hypothetical protein JST04_17275 [Bdellovibrionales bacterium]|nr:hypothetical protein [Bdellovibrionales bacterium]
MKISLKLFGLLSTFAALTTFSNANAMDLDWSGQFRSEAVLINNYAPEVQTPATGGGYEIVNAGSKDARFQSLFARLRPKLIVNDNIAIKTEWWLGNPITGFYGSDYPGASRSDQRYYDSTYSGGSVITAQRYWAEFLTDLGTFQVGRAPQHWGLGLVHHSGDGLWDRYQSTGDTYKMISKFGNFTLSPFHTKYDMGAAVGGTCIGGAATCGHPTGGATLSEYGLGLQYENKDEDFEGGVQLVRRIAGAQSESKWINNTSGGMNVTIWDIYAKKRMGKVDFAIEAPIFNGELVGYKYQAFALAAELQYRASDSWSFLAKGGKVPGQPNSPGAGTANPDKWRMVSLHPNYKLGLLMFNYNFSNFAGNNNANNSAGGAGDVKSIYDEPITNANYLLLGTALTADKWQFTFNFVTAKADQTAHGGDQFFNSRTRAYSTTAANHDQGSSIGTEFDLGVALNWDEFTTFALDFGLLMQGDYYKFNNGATDTDLKTMFGAVGSIGLKF